MAWKREFPTGQFIDEALRPVRLTLQDVEDLASIFTEFQATQPESRQDDLTFKVNSHRAESVEDLRTPPGNVNSAIFSSSIYLRLAMFPSQTLLSWDSENAGAVEAAAKVRKVLAGRELGRVSVISPFVMNSFPILLGAWIAGLVGWGIGSLVVDGYWVLVPLLGAQVLYVFAIQPWANRHFAVTHPPIWSTDQNPPGLLQRHYNGLMLLFTALAVVVPVVLWAVPYLIKE